MGTSHTTVPLHGLVYILLSMLLIIGTQIASMHAGLTLKFAAKHGRSTEELRARMRRRQTVAGVVMLAGIGAMVTLCCVYNYWPGSTSHHRRMHVPHPPPPHDAFRDLSAHLTTIPAWIFVILTGGPIALCGAAAGYGVRRLRVHMRPPFGMASFGRAMKLAVLISLMVVPFFYAMPFGTMWLSASTGENLVEAQPRWLMPSMLAYLIVFGVPPLMFTLRGSRRTWRWWLKHW
jgi:hypothetical protein